MYSCRTSTKKNIFDTVEMWWFYKFGWLQHSSMMQSVIKYKSAQRSWSGHPDYMQTILIKFSHESFIRMQHFKCDFKNFLVPLCHCCWPVKTLKWLVDFSHALSACIDIHFTFTFYRTGGFERNVLPTWQCCWLASNVPVCLQRLTIICRVSKMLTCIP